MSITVYVLRNHFVFSVITIIKRNMMPRRITMDIEAIRKRDKLRGEYEFPELAGKFAIKDRHDLLEYISFLETNERELRDLLRWRKIEEEKPKKGEFVELRNGHAIRSGCLKTDFFGNYYWDTATGAYNFDRFPEWRPI
jgi:hypothetical protein